LKLTSPIFPGVAIALLTTVFAVAQNSQSPAPPQSPAGHHHEEPAPTNLKVLPKNMTGEQVDELMHQWEGALGTKCSTCHAADPNRIGPNGRPMLNYADDSKPEKSTARLMYRMMEDINKNYVSMVENADPVTCGTCHRGHYDPEPFKVPGEHDRDHDSAHP
jgi:hypothetical protein